MALPQILSFPTPLRGVPSINRKLKDVGTKIKRTAISRIKLTKRYASQVAKKQYFLPAAYKDLRRASLQNEDIVIVAGVFSLLLAYACSVIGADFFLNLSRTMYALSEASGFNMGLLILAAVFVVCVFGALLAATSANFMALAIMDGANRKVYRSIRSTFSKSLSAASRITCAWFLLAVVHFARLMALLIPLVIYLKFFTTVMVLSNEVVIVAAGLVSFSWLMYGVIKFSLVPYVALFERQLLLNEAFGRSRELVNKHAAVFLVTGFVVTAAYLSGLFKLCMYLKTLMGTGANLLFVVGLIAALMLANGAMVMLYRKRKMARR